MEVVTDDTRLIGVANLQRMLVLLLLEMYTWNSCRVHHIREYFSLKLVCINLIYI